MIKLAVPPLSLIVLALAMALPRPAGAANLNPAAPPPEAEVHPIVGGHFGVGLTVLTVGNQPMQLIGRDIFQIGPVVGVNFGFDEHWSVDFETILLSQWLEKSTATGTAFLFDPGVVYNWGCISTGLRVGVRTPRSQGEIGLIPIFVKTFGSGRIKPYAEIDLPFFFGTSTPENSAGTFSFTTFLQGGVAF